MFTFCPENSSPSTGGPPSASVVHFAVMTIPRPKTTPVDPDHVLDCEFVLEPYFQELAAKAEASGWRPEVVTAALAGLAAARAEMLKANADTNAAIAGKVSKRRQ